MSLFDEQRLRLKEKPFARTWDDENREVFRKCGIRTERSPSLYTSVHYVIGSKSATPVTCEIQVRTLMEEVWGEVDHRINYPHKTPCLAAAEQIKALARVTSSGTRLVDSIFTSFADFERTQRRRRMKRQR
jgi:ppGpp synthetase/RelA/SpoT-type nucleotidyltranferase